MEYRQLQLDQLRRNIETMEDLREHPVYLFNADRFIQNFTDLQNEFRKIYPNTRIAYSYKTNHIPGIGHLVDKLGGYAEVVSPMELRIARVDARCEWNHIIYNGLLRDNWMVNLMKSGGIVNVESMECLKYILESVSEPLKIGIRFGEPDSRFGFQESELFDVMGQIAASNIRIAGIHCHIGGSRSMETWKRKTERMVRIAKDIEQTMKYPLEYIDLGGHLFGRMDDELREQFGDVPTFRGYAKTVATIVRDAYKDKESMPKLILEPGTALIADAVSILATVDNVKNRKGKQVATLNVSSHDCGMIADYKNLPIVNLTYPDVEVTDHTVVCGYTCMEEDYINREYKNALRTGDKVLIKNCGAYSISMKGNFIYLPLGMYMVNDSYEVLGMLREPGTSADAVERCYVGGVKCGKI